jgi:hypothetical protein
MLYFPAHYRTLRYCLCLILALACMPASPAQTVPQKRAYLDEADIEVQDSILRATANDPRPLAQMLDGLAKRFDWNPGYEDPRYDSPEDLVDSTAASWLAQNPGGEHAFIPAGGSFSVSLSEFELTGSQNESRTLDAILKAYNQSPQPGRFELLALEDGSFVAVGNAAAHGPQTPILNTKITLNIGPISAEEAFGQWARELTVASGIQVEGNSPTANNFLIQKQISVQAENLPARDVLRQIIKATGRNYSWRLLFDHDANCYFLNLTWSQKPREIADTRQLSPHSYALFVFAPSVTDSLYLQQVAALRQQNNSLPPRVEFVAVLEDPTGLSYKPPSSLAVLTPDAATSARNRFHVSQGQFHVVLFGRDKSVVAEASTPLARAQLDPLIAN